MTAPLLPEHTADCDWVRRQNTCTCPHPEYIDAVEVVARTVIRKCVEDALDYDVDWSDYPELPEFVWKDVVKRAEYLVSRGHRDEDLYDEAYQRLSALATEEA